MISLIFYAITDPSFSLLQRRDGDRKCQRCQRTYLRISQLYIFTYLECHYAYIYVIAFAYLHDGNNEPLWSRYKHKMHIYYTRRWCVSLIYILPSFPFPHPSAQPSHSYHHRYFQFFMLSDILSVSQYFFASRTLVLYYFPPIAHGFAAPSLPVSVCSLTQSARYFWYSYMYRYIYIYILT